MIFLINKKWLVVICHRRMFEIYHNENHDIAIAMSPSRADPILPWLGLFKYLNQCHWPGWEYLYIYILEIINLENLDGTGGGFGTRAWQYFFFPFLLPFSLSFLPCIEMEININIKHPTGKCELSRVQRSEWLPLTLGRECRGNDI